MSNIISRICGDLKDKKILILGYGREGRSTFELFAPILGKENICVADLNDLSGNPELSGVKTVCGENYLDAVKECDVVMKSPGIALLDLISEEDKKKVTSQTDLLLRYAENKIIGITGTKGKSTTSSLVYHILKANGVDSRLMGNIGIPPLSLCGEINEKTVLVLEMSSHQLEYVKASPNISVVLNVYSEHLDHYTSFEKYREAKFNIFKYQNAGDTIIYNACCENMPEEFFVGLKQNKIPACDGKIEGENYCCLDGESITLGIGGKKHIIPFKQLDTKLIGRHNKYNIAVAIAVCACAGVSVEDAVKSVADFYGLEHRLEYVGCFGGVHYYNDSICTIPEAAISAVKCFEKVSTLLIGGMDRGIPYDDFARFLIKSDIDNLIFMPDSGKRVLGLINSLGGCSDKKLVMTSGLEEAVKTAKELTREGGVCLLSPAAASYGFFKNFEERGKAFKELVKQGG